MEIEIDERTVRIVALAPAGRLDAFNAPALRARTEQLLADGIRLIVCDLSKVEFMDSAGLAVLVSLMKRARQDGGDVRLVWPAADAAQRILQLTKFDRVFDRFENREGAFNSFYGTGKWQGF
jgi:anti-anti-sigma factor